MSENGKIFAENEFLNLTPFHFDTRLWRIKIILFQKISVSLIKRELLNLKNFKNVINEIRNWEADGIRLSSAVFTRDALKKKFLECNFTEKTFFPLFYFILFLFCFLSCFFFFLLKGTLKKYEFNGRKTRDKFGWVIFVVWFTAVEAEEYKAELWL